MMCEYGFLKEKERETERERERKRPTALFMQIQQMTFSDSFFQKIGLVIVSSETIKEAI